MLIIDYIQPALEENQVLCPIICDLIVNLFDNALQKSSDFFQPNENQDGLEFTPQGKELLAKGIQKAFIIDIPWEQAKDFNFGFTRKDGYPVIAITFKDIDNLLYIIWVSLTPTGTRFKMGSPKTQYLNQIDLLLKDYLELDMIDLVLFLYIRNKRFTNQIQETQKQFFQEIPKEILGKAILYYRLKVKQDEDIENTISNLLKDLNIRES